MIDYKFVVILLVIGFLFCVFGSLYEEYVVEGEISKNGSIGLVIGCFGCSNKI